jgi:hypothetical protein
VSGLILWPVLVISPCIGEGGSALLQHTHDINRVVNVTQSRYNNFALSASQIGPVDALSSLDG